MGKRAVKAAGTTISMIGIGVLLLGSVALTASAREPVPFTDAYHDGYALVVWTDLTAAQAQAMIDRIRRTGATHLIIPYYGCQSDIHASDVGACEVRAHAFRTPATSLARMAIAAGFTEVSYLPIVATPDWQWRGFFDPKDVAAWFKSYTAWIKGVARDAQSLGMKELVVGTEMTALYKYEVQWKQVLADVRTEFKGPLVLTVNWGDTEHSFWGDADAIGVSAYYPLSDRASPAQAELDAAWQKQHDQFIALSQRWARPIHITEVGYSSLSSAAHTPWAGQPGDASDPALQARCYEAFRKAWGGERRLVRANVWATNVQAPTEDDYPFSFETIGKPAEDVLKAFFGERLGLAFRR